jgi:TRAP-type C4-dicarboxylate transport system substrate-binding protein
VTTTVKNTVVSAAFATVLGAGLAQAADFKFNLANEYPASSLPAQAEQHFVDELKKRSGGRIEIVLHLGGSLGYKSRDHYTAVLDGAVQLASTPFDKIIGFAPIYALQSLPFVTPTFDQTEALYHVARPYYEAAFNKANQTLLFGAPWTPSGIWSKNRITSIDDLKGLKVRTIDSTSTKTFKDAGAAPIQLAWGDVVPSLTTNVISAVQTSDEGGVSVKIWEAGAKYFNALGYSLGINAVTMNLDVYKKLPDDLKKILRDVAADAERHAWQVGRSRVEHNRKIMKDSGAVFVDDVPKPVIEHLMKAGAPMFEEWKTQMGPDADKILAEYRKRTSS